MWSFLCQIMSFSVADSFLTPFKMVPTVGRSNIDQNFTKFSVVLDYDPLNFLKDY